MGCLRSLLARIGCLVVLVGLVALGYLYRHEAGEYYRAWRGTPAAAFVPPVAGGAASAREALGRLTRHGGPAYEDLTAGDVAALVSEALGTGGKRVLDSVQVALLEGEIRVRGVLDLSGVPRNLLGPLSGAIGEREPAAIGGPLSVDSAGRLVLTVTYLRLRDFPFPRATVPRLLEAAHIPGARGARVPLPGTPRLGDVRVSPAHVRFYRGTPQ